MADSDLKNLVPKLAGLAHLKLSAEEQKRLDREFQSIVEFVGQVGAVEVKDAVLTATISGVEHVLREDRIEPSLVADVLVARAPDAHARYLRSPGVLS